MATCTVTEDWPNFSFYIRKVGYQVHPNANFPKATLTYLNDMMLYIASAIIQLVNQHEVKITFDMIQTAIKEYLKDAGEIRKHAISEGNKAVIEYNSFIDQSKKGQNRLGTPNQTKAGLIFSVARIEKIFELCGLQTNIKASVFLAGVLEYITAELLELAGNIAIDKKVVRITVNHVEVAIQNDPELVITTRAFFNPE